MLLLGLIGIQVVLALRIIPVYMNYSTVKSILEEMEDDPDDKGQTPNVVKSLIFRKLQVNNIYDLQKDPHAFTFKKLTDGLQISLYYEARGPVYGNLEFVATFEHEVVIPKR